MGVNVNWIGSRMYDQLFKKSRSNHSVSQQSYFLKQALSTASTLFFLMLQWLKMAKKIYLCKKKSLVCKAAAASYRNTNEQKPGSMRFFSFFNGNLDSSVLSWESFIQWYLRIWTGLTRRNEMLEDIHILIVSH